METGNPLDQLRGIHLPDAPGFWPLAPGWWLIGIVILGLIILLIYKWHKSKHTRLVKKQALDAIENIFVNKDKGQLPYRTNIILKRTAISMGYAQSKPLYGEDWLLFLDNTANGKTSFQSSLPEFAASSYRPEVALDGNLLKQQSIQWIKAVKHA